MYSAKKPLISPGPKPLKNSIATITGGKVLIKFIKIFTRKAIFLLDVTELAK